MQIHKNIIHLVLLVFVALIANAGEWQIAKSTHLPRCGDKVELEHISLSSVGSSGKNVVWDFSEAQLNPKTEYIKYLLRGEERIGLKYNGQCLDYSISGDTLKYIGFEHRNACLQDSIPGVKITYPFAYGDSCESRFLFKGKHSVNLDACQYGQITTIADGCGLLILPDNDSITNTIRVRTDIRTKGIISLKEQTCYNDATDFSDSSLLRQYEWYAPGYRYPLLTVNEVWLTMNGKESLQARDAFTLSRHNQEYALKQDSENEEIRQKLYESISQHPSIFTESNTPPPMIEKVDISASAGRLSIEFTASSTGGDAEFIISDAAGIAYLTIPRHHVVEGENHLVADCSRLPLGEYALLFIYGEQRLSFTFTCR